MTVPRCKSQYPNTFEINIKDETFYYSYETCIGYVNFNHNLQIRNSKYFSKTTSKHVGKLGIASFTPIDNEEFYLLIEKCQNK